jgi:hypothetical protein
VRALPRLRRLDRAELWAVASIAGFVLALCGGPLAVSFAVSPEEIESGAVQLSPPCPVLAETGEECASCGLTRGFTAMSRLRVSDAAAYNAAAPWLYLACWAGALAAALALGRLAAEAGRRRAGAQGRTRSSQRSSIARSST